MPDDGSPKPPDQEEGFFDSANAEEAAFGQQHLGRRIAILAAMLALMLGGGVCVAWAIIAASK
jgi:hypothetical protein